MPASLALQVADLAAPQVDAGVERRQVCVAHAPQHPAGVEGAGRGGVMRQRDAEAVGQLLKLRLFLRREHAVCHHTVKPPLYHLADLVFIDGAAGVF